MKNVLQKVLLEENTIIKNGAKRINIELKVREISRKTLTLLLQEIPEELYIQNFNELAEKQWNSIAEKNSAKKNKNG